MDTQESYDNQLKAKEVAKVLSEFKKLPPGKRKNAYNNIFAFMIGFKLGAKLGDNLDEKVTA